MNLYDLYGWLKNVTFVISFVTKKLFQKDIIAYFS